MGKMGGRIILIQKMDSPREIDFPSERLPLYIYKRKINKIYLFHFPCLTAILSFHNINENEIKTRFKQIIIFFACRYTFIPSKHTGEPCKIIAGEPIFENPCSYEAVEKVIINFKIL